MATSPIYSWPEPDNTDLVKNGALAIRTMGNAIDTTMGTMTPKSIYTAKGSIAAATAASTPANLNVGNNGETIVADSSTSTGLRYTGNYAAGLNKFLNGDFSVWQRGTSFTGSAAVNGSYTADRFKTENNSTTGVTISQQTFTPGTAPIAGYEGTYFYRYAVSTASTVQGFGQSIEDVRTFAGQTATFSFFAKAAANTTVTTIVTQTFGSGGSALVDAGSTTMALTTSWQRFTYTIAIPSVSGKTIGSGSYLALRFLNLTNTTFTMDFWGFKAEAGSVATAFQTATGTIQGELAACQRYYYLHASGNTVPICTTGNYSTTLAIGWLCLPVTMRTAPTLVAASGSGFYSIDVGGAGLTFNVPTIGAASTTSVRLDAAVTGATVGYAGYLRTSNASASIAFNSEL